MANEPTSSGSPLPPLPDSQDPELEQYRLRSPQEMARVFRDMAKAGELITAHVDADLSFLTTLLGVDAETGRIYLDYSPDEGLNARALKAPQLVLAGRHMQVRVQFTLSSLARVVLKDGPAFAAPFPSSILRIQRREFYRLTTPVALRPVCRLVLEDGTAVAATIVDISLGGIGIIEAGAEHESLWQPGRVIRDAQIELTPEVRIRSDIEIRNRHAASPAAGGQPQVHVGCRFVHLDSRMNAEIQRYIHRVDLERRRLARD